MVKTRASKYRGVYRCGNKWKAQIQVDGTQYYLGVFDEQEAASEAYKTFAKKHGRFFLVDGEGPGSDHYPVRDSTIPIEKYKNGLELLMKDASDSDESDEPLDDANDSPPHQAPTQAGSVAMDQMFTISNHSPTKGRRLDLATPLSFSMNSEKPSKMPELILPPSTSSSRESLSTAASQPPSTSAATAAFGFHAKNLFLSPLFTPMEKKWRDLFVLKLYKMLLGKCLYYASLLNVQYFQVLLEEKESSGKRLTVIQAKKEKMKAQTLRVSHCIQMLVQEIVKSLPGEWKERRVVSSLEPTLSSTSSSSPQEMYQSEKP